MCVCVCVCVRARARTCVCVHYLYSHCIVLQGCTTVNYTVQILSAEGVLACESWPMFKKLLIYENPFTAAHKGEGDLYTTCVLFI